MFLEINFWFLITAYVKIGNGDFTNVIMLLQVSGAFGFLTAVCGYVDSPPPQAAKFEMETDTFFFFSWYLLMVLLFATVGLALPFQLPVGDLSNFLAAKPKDA